jgi:hypothetical protein
MELLPGERKVSEASNGTVVLTSHRIRLDRGTRGFTSICLDQVASCSIATRSYPVLLVLAAVVWLAAFQLAGERMTTIPFVSGAVLGGIIVLVYILSRQQAITIATCGESMRLETRGMSRSACVQFVDDLERARLAIVLHPRS